MPGYTLEKQFRFIFKRAIKKLHSGTNEIESSSAIRPRLDIRASGG